MSGPSTKRYRLEEDPIDGQQEITNYETKVSGSRFLILGTERVPKGLTRVGLGSSSITRFSHSQVSTLLYPKRRK